MQLGWAPRRSKPISGQVDTLCRGERPAFLARRCQSGQACFPGPAGPPNQASPRARPTRQPEPFPSAPLPSRGPLPALPGVSSDSLANWVWGHPLAPVAQLAPTCKCRVQGTRSFWKDKLAATQAPTRIPQGAGFTHNPRPRVSSPLQ